MGSGGCLATIIGVLEINKRFTGKRRGLAHGWSLAGNTLGGLLLPLLLSLSLSAFLMRPRNGSGSGNGRGGQTGPSFQSECDSASAMLVGKSKRPRSTVVEGGRPGCDRRPRPQYWNIDTTSLYAAFAERTACFFRPPARPRRLRFSYRIVL